VAHACHPSYSGNKRSGGSRFKASLANSSTDPISKNSSQKRADGVAQGVGPEFKPQHQNKKKRKRIKFRLFQFITPKHLCLTIPLSNALIK
jgi:hypothetical protein